MAGRGHQPDPLTRRQVEAMAGYGVTEIDIGGIIGIDPKTLRKHYRKELDYGHTKANIKVAENLYRKATGEGRESVTAAIFWLKARAGWREKQIHEIQTPESFITRIERVIVPVPSPEASSPRGMGPLVLLGSGTHCPRRSDGSPDR